MEAAVISARFAKPLDEELIRQVAQRCGGVVTVEENAAAGGFGSGVVNVLAAHDIAVPVKILALPDAFVPHGDRARLLADCGLDVDGIAAAARELLREKT